MAKIKAWSDHIIRHFWYCSNVCKESENTSDEEALQIMKVGEILNVYNLIYLEYFYIALSVLLPDWHYASHNADCLLSHNSYIFLMGQEDQAARCHSCVWSCGTYNDFFVLLFSILLLEQVDWPTSSCL